MFTAAAIGALIGYWIGRIPGLLIGAILGFWLGRAVQRKIVNRGLGHIQTQFLDSTFAVMGAMCKADGQVTSDEIRVAEQLFDRLRLSGERRETAKAAFNRGKADDFDLDAEVNRFRSVSRGNRVLLELFLQVQLSAIAADGVLDEQERNMLLRVARGLGLSEADIERLEAMLRGGDHDAAGSQKSLDDAYAVLGVDSSASEAEVKKAYRRLMSQNHPDKLAGQGLPEDMRQVAEERTREIRSAYDTILQARQTA